MHIYFKNNSTTISLLQKPSLICVSSPMLSLPHYQTHVLYFRNKFVISSVRVLRTFLKSMLFSSNLASVCIQVFIISVMLCTVRVLLDSSFHLGNDENLERLLGIFGTKKGKDLESTILKLFSHILSWKSLYSL